MGKRQFEKRDNKELLDRAKESLEDSKKINARGDELAKEEGNFILRVILKIIGYFAR